MSAVLGQSPLRRYRGSRGGGRRGKAEGKGERPLTADLNRALSGVLFKILSFVKQPTRLAFPYRRTGGPNARASLRLPTQPFSPSSSFSRPDPVRRGTIPAHVSPPPRCDAQVFRRDSD